MACGPKLEKLPWWARWLGDWLVPDLVFGAACEEHDRAYERGGTEADRAVADERFLRDMLAVAGVQRWGTRWLWRRLARVYYEAVRTAGGFAFAYRG